jgi:hypothetical protein
MAPLSICTNARLRPLANHFRALTNYVARLGG